MDFMADQFVDGKCFRIFTVVDHFDRSCPMLHADTSIGAGKVVEALERAGARAGLPKAITVDNDPEFAGKVLDAWAYRRGIHLDFIRPGKPVDPEWSGEDCSAGTARRASCRRVKTAISRASTEGYATSC